MDDVIHSEETFHQDFLGIHEEMMNVFLYKNILVFHHILFNCEYDVNVGDIQKNIINC